MDPEKVRSDRLISVDGRHVCVTPLVSSRSACRRHATRIRGSGETSKRIHPYDTAISTHPIDLINDRVGSSYKLPYKILFVLCLYRSIDPFLLSLIDRFERKGGRKEKGRHSLFFQRAFRLSNIWRLIDHRGVVDADSLDGEIAKNQGRGSVIDASGRTGIIHAGLTLSFLRFAASMILCFEEILESSSWLVNRVRFEGWKMDFFFFSSSSFWKDL